MLSDKKQEYLIKMLKATVEKLLSDLTRKERLADNNVIFFKEPEEKIPNNIWSCDSCLGLNENEFICKFCGNPKKELNKKDPPTHRATFRRSNKKDYEIDYNTKK